MPTFGLAMAKSLFEGEIVPKLPPCFCRKRLNRAWNICDVIGSFSPDECAATEALSSAGSRDAVGIFWKPTFYPNHRARNPHPGDGPDPLLGPRIFRALRLLGSILKRFGGALGSILKRFGGRLAG